VEVTVSVRSSERFAQFGLALSLIASAACAPDDAVSPSRVATTPSLVTAAAVVVTNTNDDGPGSLRDAIATAASGSTIQFDASVAGQAIVLTSGELVIAQPDLTIEGPAAGMVVSGNGQYRVFDITGQSATLRNVTISDGLSDDGGGILVATAADATLDHVLVLNNVAGATASSTGGGISVHGTLSLTNVTVAANSAALYGGGIYITGQAAVNNSTIASNRGVKGGGIAMFGSLSLKNSIIANNTATAAFPNCDLANNPIAIFGTNLASDATCGTGAGIVVGDAALSPPANNGGPTQTMALGKTSAAIDAATNCTVTDDQRYVARPQGIACDIGAYEFNDYVTLGLTISNSSIVSSKTGVAVVSGSVTCSAPTPVQLSVDLSQLQKLKRATVTLEASDVTTVACAGTTFWSIALTPASGGFEAGDATAIVKTINVAPGVNPSVATASVNLSWQKK
jgi:hypothetical protein